MHGIILHEEYRERMKNLSPCELGKIVQNLFLVDDEKEPEKFDNDYLDFLSETVCGRLKRDIEMSDKQRDRRLGKTKNNQTKTKKNQTITKQEPKKTPITNNLLPITNNQLNNYSIVTEIVKYLNDVTKKNYQVKGKTYELINARLNEGYTPDDLKKVIDVKYREWKGTAYEKFVRPSTLFAPSHFEEYLNQPEKEPVKQNAFTKTGTDRDYDFDELEKSLVKN